MGTGTAEKEKPKTDKEGKKTLEPPRAYFEALGVVKSAQRMTETVFWRTKLFSALKQKVDDFRASCMEWDNASRQEAQMYNQVLGEVTACLSDAVFELNATVDAMMAPLFQYHEIVKARLNPKRGTIELVPVPPKKAQKAANDERRAAAE